MCPPKKYLTVQPNSTITIIITDPVIKMTLDPGCGRHHSASVVSFMCIQAQPQFELFLTEFGQL